MITKHTPATLQAFEARIAETFNCGEIPHPVHLSGGNERQLIDIFQQVRPQDWVLTSWRSHYHCLLKGVSEDELETAIRAGRSIALCFPEHRILSSAIVGGTLPIAVGLAMASVRNNSYDSVWCFVGDMTARTGAFHEATQYAAGHRLPITFVVEDNGLSVCTPTREAWAASDDVVWNIRSYDYVNPWPHSGAGVRVNF